MAEVLRSVADYGSVDVPQDPNVASHNVAPGEITRMEVSGRRSHFQTFARGAGLSAQQLVMRQQLQMKKLFEYMKRTWAVIRPKDTTTEPTSQAPAASDLPLPTVGHMAAGAALAEDRPEVGSLTLGESEAIIALKKELTDEISALDAAHSERETYHLSFRSRLWEGYLLGEQGSKFAATGALLDTVGPLVTTWCRKR